jgi:hypothetical protein
MLRLNRQFKTRVSNRLALMAAVMLTISLLIGFGDRMESRLNLSPAATAQAADQPVTTPQVKKNRKFKASLFLLRLK